MRVIVQVRIHHDDDEPDGDGELIDIAEIDRTDLAASTTGLSIDEAKQILAGVQDTVVTEHAAEVLAARAHCDRCGRRFASKDSRAITMGTLYGSHRIGSPRWWTCPCSGPRRTFSPLTELLAERVTPELALVEAKLAAHMSYQAACGLLGELFPVGRRLHRSEMLRTVARLADRFDTELAADEVSYRDRHDLDDTTPPGMPIVVTIDGGYGHSAEQTSRRDGWFQAVCGTVTTHAGETRRFGFVPNVDPTPRSRIRGVLETQGLRQDQLVTFLTDGADDLAGFCEHMNHTAEHVLDWFHIAMRFTIISNTVTNVAWTASLDDCEDADTCDRLVEQMRVDIGRAKWFLWHGNHYRALQVLDDVAFILQSCDPTLMHAKATKLLGELVGYIEHNRHRIPSYAERRLAGEPISSAPAEGAVNQVIAKRMIKKQQMRWNPHGAHRLLQIRTASSTTTSTTTSTAGTPPHRPGPSRRLTSHALQRVSSWQERG